MDTLLDEVTEVVSRNADEVIHLICPVCYEFEGPCPPGVVSLCGEPLVEGEVEADEDAPVCPMCADVPRCPVCGNLFRPYS